MNEKTAIDDLVVNTQKQKSELLTALELIVNQDNIEGKTILNNQQVQALTMMNWAGQVYEIPFLQEFVVLYPRYRISGDDGRGRNEIIKIAQAVQLREDDRTKTLSEIMNRR